MWKAWLSLFLFSALAGIGLKPALRKLSEPPTLSAGQATPYSGELEEKLIETFAEERRLANAEIPKTADKKERQRHLFATWSRKNDGVAERLAKSGGQPGADEKTILEVYRELAENPVARVDAVTRYDKRGDVGFCFGRAMLVHYLLLIRKIAPENIAKIFAVGKLRYKNQLWDFHMATMVRGWDGQWWVIDTLFEKPLPFDEWRKMATAFGASREFPEVRLFVTDPRKFQPNYPAYRLSDLSVPELKPFFSQLFSSVSR